MKMTNSDSDCELFDTQTPEFSSNLNPDEQQDMKPTWGKLFSTTVYLQSVDLYRSQFLFGRDEKCDVVLTHKNFNPTCLKTISKNHFKITWEEENFPFITDLSKNGTFVNQVLVGNSNKVILQNDDEIAVGTLGQRVYIYKNIEKTEYLPFELRKKYEISRVLGTGAYGEVRLAFEKSTCKEFAIKKIVKSRMISIKKCTSLRIENESEILQNLSHPCIISISDIAESRDALFMVLEYMPGGELSDLILAKDTPLPEKNTKLLFYQMVLGIRYLHLREISHRDLKPGNILLNENKMETLIKISDFGLSKMSNNTFMSTFCGTPSYVAPEIININCKVYTQQVDVWSLGVILFLMLSNELPFRGEVESQQSLFKAILSGKYSMNSDRWKLVSEDAKDLLRRMLIVNPDERITIHKILDHSWLSTDEEMQKKARSLMYVNNEFDVVAAKRPRLEFETL